MSWHMLQIITWANLGMHQLHQQLFLEERHKGRHWQEEWGRGAEEEGEPWSRQVCLSKKENHLSWLLCNQGTATLVLVDFSATPMLDSTVLLCTCRTSSSELEATKKNITWWKKSISAEFGIHIIYASSLIDNLYYDWPPIICRLSFMGRLLLLCCVSWPSDLCQDKLTKISQDKLTLWSLSSQDKLCRFRWLQKFRFFPPQKLSN